MTLLLIGLYLGIAVWFAWVNANRAEVRAAATSASLRWLAASCVGACWAPILLWAFISVLSDRAKRATRAM